MFSEPGAWAGQQTNTRSPARKKPVAAGAGDGLRAAWTSKYESGEVVPLRLTGAADRRAELARHHVSASGCGCCCLGRAAFGVRPRLGPRPHETGSWAGAVHRSPCSGAVGWALGADGERASCSLGRSGLRSGLRGGGLWGPLGEGQVLVCPKTNDGGPALVALLQDQPRQACRSFLRALPTDDPSVAPSVSEGTDTSERISCSYAS